MLHDCYVRDRFSLQIDLSQRELQPDGIAPQLLVELVEISQVSLGVLDPPVGLHSRRDRLQVLPEPGQRRRLLDQIVHQQPALGIAHHDASGIAGAEDGIIADELAYGNPGHPPLHSGQVVHPPQVEPSEITGPRGLARLAVGAQTLDDAKRRVPRAVEQARVERKLVRSLVGQGLHVEVRRPWLHGHVSPVEDVQHVGRLVVDSRRLNGSSLLGGLEQRRQAEKLAKRSVVTKHDHDQGAVRLVQVEPKGTKIPLIIRGKLFEVGEDRRDECCGGVPDRHVMCRVDGAEGADPGLVQFISGRGELGVRRQRRRGRALALRWTLRFLGWTLRRPRGRRAAAGADQPAQHQPEPAAPIQKRRSRFGFVVVDSHDQPAISSSPQVSPIPRSSSISNGADVGNRHISAAHGSRDLDFLEGATTGSKAHSIIFMLESNRGMPPGSEKPAPRREDCQDFLGQPHRPRPARRTRGRTNPGVRGCAGPRVVLEWTGTKPTSRTDDYHDDPVGSKRGLMDGQGGSITHWLGDLRGGDLAAAQPLWERYFGRLVVLARGKLERQRHPRAEADEEDAALSAFNSFCVGVAQGRFPQLADREDLWRILMTITVRKAYAQVQRQKRLKRGGGRVVEEAALRSPKGDSPFDAASAAGLAMIAGEEPTPEFAAMVAEEYRRLLDALEDDGLRQVAISRMEGYTCDEIAAQLGCARRTVARRLDLIRKTWLAHVEVA